ncbi:MAG TPA: transglycosylase SLT domain-containing protein [Solirubrobacterales bacterium]
MAPKVGQGAEPGGERRLGEGARALIGLAAVLVIAAAIAIPVALLLGGDDPPEVRTEEVAAAGRDAGGQSDPFAWKPDRREDLERRAAAGLAHVLYANSPGGVLASAKRTARWRDEIEAAAKGAGIDPDLLEAMVFLESAGRPDVIAGSDVEAASGLTQILASTGIDLLGMEIDVDRSEELTKKAAKASARGEEGKFRALLRERAQVDERFDPEEALAATGRYLTTARESFAEDDLAVTSYHMGIGNLEDVIQAYAGSDAPARDLVESEDLSYAQLFFDSSPTRHPEAWDVLSRFADDSATYLWRVYAAREIMRLYREDPGELELIADLQTRKATQEEVFHPEDATEIFDDPGEIEAARDSGELVPLPVDPSLGFRPSEQMGELATKLDQPRELYRALRPEALATLVYLSSQVQETSGADRPLRVTSTVRDREYQELLVGTNPEATSEYSLHTTGWSFDILRKYDSDAQGEAFQFALDRLRALNVLDYAYEPAAIHVTVGPGAAPLVDD